MIRIHCTHHAWERFRERVDGNATEADVCWAAIEGQGVASGVAMALVGRQVLEAERRFVVTPCLRGLLVIADSGNIVTVLTLPVGAEAVLASDAPKKARHALMLLRHQTEALKRDREKTQGVRRQLATRVQELSGVMQQISGWLDPAELAELAELVPWLPRWRGWPGERDMGLVDVHREALEQGAGR
jgi:hypothetical protein